MTIIEIRPFRNGWQVYEAPGVQPVFLNQEQAIDYATWRARFRSGEIRVFGLSGDLASPLRYPRLISVQLFTYIYRACGS
jgi:hypothetical protein